MLACLIVRVFACVGVLVRVSVHFYVGLCVYLYEFLYACVCKYMLCVYYVYASIIRYINSGNIDVNYIC